MSHESLSHIALHDDPRDMFDDAVATARRITGVDSSFAAIATQPGCFGISVRDGLSQPGWATLQVRDGRGLGGRVLSEKRARLVPDYLHEPSITGDYRDVVQAEGLHGMACVPVPGPDGLAALLYVADRHRGEPGDRLVDAALRIADMVTVGLVMRARMALGLRRPAPLPAPAGVSAPLTPREREVLRLLDAGASNRELAERLVIAESTAKGHVRALCEKLGTRSRLAAVAEARRLGLL
ncbi:MAG: transcriptional regulator, LuxR family [Solirubrobacterales bacterium]|nr:transcriptional regulator, LuxR family [Solirubrobacterales bacterium]